MGRLLKGKMLWVSFILVVSAFVLTAACTGPLGPVGQGGSNGPAGAEGPQGTSGDSGAMGEDGMQGRAGAAGRTGLPGADGAEGDKGNPGAAGKSAYNPQATIRVVPSTFSAGGDQDMTVWFSGFPARDTVTAVIFSAFGPGRNYLLAAGDASLGGAGAFTIKASERLPVPADLTPGYYTVQVTGTRTTGDVIGPVAASLPIHVLAVGEEIPPEAQPK